MRYLTVGVLNTMVGLGIIYLALYRFHLGSMAANGIGYAVGIACSFVLNRRWTFTSDGHAGAQFIRFLVVTAIAYIANLATVVALIKGLGTNHYIAQAVGVVPYTLIGYAGNRWFVFRDRPA